MLAGVGALGEGAAGQLLLFVDAHCGALCDQRQPFVLRRVGIEFAAVEQEGHQPCLRQCHLHRRAQALAGQGVGGSGKDQAQARLFGIQQLPGEVGAQAHPWQRLVADIRHMAVGQLLAQRGGEEGALLAGLGNLQHQFQRRQAILIDLRQGEGHQQHEQRRHQEQHRQRMVVAREQKEFLAHQRSQSHSEPPLRCR